MKSPRNSGGAHLMHSAGKEVQTSNLDPADLEAIIEFIETYLKEPPQRY
jgi:hypothetical protein